MSEDKTTLNVPPGGLRSLIFHRIMTTKLAVKAVVRHARDGFMRNTSDTRIFASKTTTIAEATAITLLVVLYFVWKSAYVAQQLVPIWDGNVYLLNAHDLLTSQPLYIWNYPLLLSAIIALVWSVVGENYLPVRFFNLAFTLATAIVLYYSSRSEFGRIPSFLETITYLTSIEILIWSDQIHVHGLTSLFAILALLAWRKHNYFGSIVGGISAALSVLARYASLAIALPIFIAFGVTNRKRPKFTAAAILGACIPTLVYQLAVPFVLPNFLNIWIGYGFHDVGPLGSLPPYYYVANWYTFFGIIGLVGLVALFLPSTYRSESSRAWAFWLIGMILFFSVTPLKDDRYTFEWTPAVVYLSFMLLIKIKDRLLTRPPQSWSRFLPGRLGSSQRIFGIVLLFVVVLQSYAFGSAYIQYQHNFPTLSYQNNPGLLEAADHLKSHIPLNATFVTDVNAPALTYFSGRKSKPICAEPVKPFSPQNGKRLGGLKIVHSVVG